jgi:hypothetical protein
VAGATRQANTVWRRRRTHPIDAPPRASRRPAAVAFDASSIEAGDRQPVPPDKILSSYNTPDSSIRPGAGRIPQIPATTP